MIHTFYIGQHSTPAKIINIVINIVIITVFVFLDLAINSKMVSGRKEGRRQKMFTSIFPFYMCNMTTTNMFFSGGQVHICTYVPEKLYLVHGR